MNTNTNVLYRDEQAALADLSEASNPKDVVPIPEHLTRAARRKLAGKESAQVSFISGGLLSRFAAKLRASAQR